MKKIQILLILVCMIGLASCLKQPKTNDVRLGIVIDTPTISSTNPNIMLEYGAFYANYNLGVPYKIFGDTGAAALVNNVNQLIAEGYNLITISYRDYLDSIESLVKQNSGTNFIVINQEIEKDYSNLHVQSYDAIQTAYFHGYLAAAWADLKADSTAPKQIAILSDKASAANQKLFKAFEKGASRYDSIHEVQTIVVESYTGDFNDTALAGIKADELYNDGIFVIYANLGSAAEAVFRRAEQHQKFSIGTYFNCLNLYSRYSNYIIGSEAKELDNVFYKFVYNCKMEKFYSHKWVANLSNTYLKIYLNQFHLLQFPNATRTEFENLFNSILAGQIDVSKLL